MIASRKLILILLPFPALSKLQVSTPDRGCQREHIAIQQPPTCYVAMIRNTSSPSTRSCSRIIYFVSRVLFRSDV